MRVFGIAATLLVLIAAPGFAQTDRIYVAGLGGVVSAPGTTSGDVMGEIGARVAPRLFVFGDLGRYHNLQPSDVQPAVDSTTAALASSTGLNVIGSGRVPAWYSIGGLRYEIPSRSRIAPYVIGGAGVARLTPTAKFAYSSGALPDGSTPAIGDDVTNQLVVAGDFTQPAATNALMVSLGGGVDIPITGRWSADAGYRYSRVQADTPVNAQGLTIGLGYRF
jgi:opacity protein-like surface antigen